MDAIFSPEKFSVKNLLDIYCIQNIFQTYNLKMQHQRNHCPSEEAKIYTNIMLENYMDNFVFLFSRIGQNNLALRVAYSLHSIHQAYVKSTIQAETSIVTPI